jgi:REP-associated tyrosine transposase
MNHGGKTSQLACAFHLEHRGARAVDRIRLAGRSIWDHWRHHEEKEAKLICAGGMFDHVHLYSSLPSTISIAEFVNIVKSNSSRWVHESFPNRKGFAWQEGYGGFSVSKSEEQNVIAYILNQPRHHAKRTFKEEFVEFLERYEVEYDPKFLCD